VRRHLRWRLRCVAHGALRCVARGPLRCCLASGRVDL